MNHSAEVPSATSGSKKSPITEVDLLVHAIAAPVIYWKGWEGTFLDRREEVVMARLKKLGSGGAEHRATDLEVALYLASVSLEKPLAEREFHVYIHCLRRAFGNKATDRVSARAGIALAPDERQLYDALGAWIFQVQLEQLVSVRSTADVSE